MGSQYGGGLMYSKRSYSQADHYRRLAIATRHRAAQAIDTSVKAAFEEVANNWLALAEQVEWLQEKRTRLGGRGAPSGATGT